MTRYLWLFGLLLGVPLIGFGVAQGLRAHFDSEVQSVIHQQYPTLDAEALSQFTLDRICEKPDPALSELCETNGTLKLMRGGAIAAGLGGVGLILLIALCGLAAQGSRSLLLVLFKPGLYFTATALTVLILLHAALFMAAIYYGESALVGRVHIGIIAAVGLGAIGGVFAIARGAFSVVRKAETFAVGNSLSREDAPELWKQVTRTADRMRALSPDHIVVGLDPNFYVTEADVVTLSGTLAGRTLFCSMPLARLLTKSEFTAIVGHELGHFRGSDTKFSERFYPIYRGTVTSIESLRTAGGQGSGSIALLPAIVILSYFLESFAVAETRLGRDRELAADEAGSEVTDARTMATALVKVHAYAGLWSQLQQAAVEAMKEQKIFVNASKLYAEAAKHEATPEVLQGLAETHLAHPTDTHPPLALRLHALGVEMASVSEAALVVSPDEPAIALVGEYERHEQEISESYQLLLAHRLGIELSPS